MKLNSKKGKRITSIVLAVIFSFISFFGSTTSLLREAFAASGDRAQKDIDWENKEDWYIYDHYDEKGTSHSDGFVSSQNVTGSALGDFDDISRPYYAFKDGHAGGRYYTNIKDIENEVYPTGAVANFSQHMYVTPEGSSTKISFLGNGSRPFADFMLYKNGNDNGVKTVSFDINMKNLGTHTFDGAGILFNAKVDEATSPLDSTLKGYLLYFKVTNPNAGQGTLHLINLKELGNVTLDQLHQGNINIPQGELLESWTLGSNRELRINLVIKQDSVSISRQIRDNNEWKEKETYDRELEDVYGNDFGPITKYLSHGCSELTHIEMNNFTMSSGYTASFHLNDEDEDNKYPAKWQDSGFEGLVSNIESDTSIGEMGAWPDDPVRYGYEFMGWNTQATGSGDEFTKDTKISDITHVYAQWKPITTKIIYNVDENGDTSGKTEQDFPIKDEFITEFPVVNVPKDKIFTDTWRDQDGNEYKVDPNGKIISGGPIKIEDKKEYEFTPIVLEDKNGDGIDDNEQALYSIKFVDGTNGKATIDDPDVEYWIAGDENTKPGDALSLDDSTVTISRNGVENVKLGTKEDLIAPKVTCNEDFKTYIWEYKGIDYTSKEIEDKADLDPLNRNVVYTLKLTDDTNADGIADSKQAIYTVEFKIKNPNMGRFCDNAITKFIIAGGEGTKQGDSVTIDNAKSIQDASNIVKKGLGAEEFKVPKIEGNSVGNFSGEWNDGKTTCSEDEINKGLELTDNIVFTAEMKAETGAIEFVGFGKIYGFNGEVTIGETLGNIIETNKDTGISAKDSAGIFKEIRTGKLSRPRYKITGWLINGVGSVYTNEQLLNYRVVGPTKFVAIYSIGNEV